MHVAEGLDLPPDALPPPSTGCFGGLAASVSLGTRFHVRCRRWVLARNRFRRPTSRRADRAASAALRRRQLRDGSGSRERPSSVASLMREPAAHRLSSRNS